ncbi:hypothetical protein PVAND_007586 [Polypedilum vanderplanki]|uniref:C2H2-type domain-containing protein n=1 Tax=Polypedilum vanderplanki TaxID=319348 RepID=A0A9J6C6S3_POLVA|nr:hypothetical protein PVAND_007586 [Polypedilum vanderplanki]
MSLKLIKNVNIEPVEEFFNQNSECFAIKITLSKESFGSAATTFEFSTNNSNLKLKLNVTREELEGAKQQIPEVQKTPLTVLSIQSIASKHEEEAIKKRKRSNSVISIDENETEEKKTEENVEKKKKFKTKRMSKVEKLLNSRFSIGEDKDEKDSMNSTKEIDKSFVTPKNSLPSKNKKAKNKKSKKENEENQSNLESETDDGATTEEDEVVNSFSLEKMFEEKFEPKNLAKDDSVCEICNKVMKKGNYKRHLRTHDENDEKDFKCNICDYSTNYRTSMKRHKEKLHSDKNESENIEA